MISKKTTIEELGAVICEALKKEGIDAFLSGGAVVSIYTDNKYESWDLDFVSLGSREKIKKVMTGLGFSQDRGRHFIHPKSDYFVEFPGAAVMVGDEPITEFETRKTKAGVIKLLTPTDCVKDRLAAFYHWNDRQALDQAVWVTQAQPVKLKRVEEWSKREGKVEKFLEFKALLKK